MLKPEGCKGCPFYGKGTGFIEDNVPSEARLVLFFDMPPKAFTLGDAREVYEAQYFRREFLRQTGFAEEDIGYAHLLRCKEAIGKKGKPVQEAVKVCRQYDYIPNSAIVAAVGKLSWRKLTGITDSRSAWRGYYADTNN